jgi:peroxiredoxin
LKKLFGGKKMSALIAGTFAPDFTLSTLEAKEFSLREALAHGPVLLVFFKISCPVCQFTFPFIERIYQAHGSRNVAIIGISQNDRKETVSFLKEFGGTFPVLLDDAKTYPVSNAYGLTNVPTLFWIGQDGTIEISRVGWMRKEIDEINRRAAELSGIRPVPVFRGDENIPEFRAG